jgi:preprotein translocase subunit SecG
MKLIVIIAITIILLIPIDIFTQEESSSELTARLDAKNSSVCKIGRL